MSLHDLLAADVAIVFADWGQTGWYVAADQKTSARPCTVVADESPEARGETPTGQQVARMARLLVQAADLGGLIPAVGDRIEIDAGQPQEGGWAVRVIDRRDAASWTVQCRSVKPGPASAPGRREIR